MSTTIFKAIKIKPTSTIRLAISVGYAQAGITSVKLNGNLVVANHDHTKIPVLVIEKPATELIGKQIDCYTSVRDIIPETDMTCVNYKITEIINEAGIKKEKVIFEQKLEESVKTDGVKNYLASFFFYA